MFMRSTSMKQGWLMIIIVSLFHDLEGTSESCTGCHTVVFSILLLSLQNAGLKSKNTVLQRNDAIVLLSVRTKGGSESDFVVAAF